MRVRRTFFLAPLFFPCEDFLSVWFRPRVRVRVKVGVRVRVRLRQTTTPKTREYDSRLRQNTKTKTKEYDYGLRLRLKTKSKVIYFMACCSLTNMPTYVGQND